MNFYHFFDYLCLEYSDNNRIWKECESNPHSIICTKNLNENKINIDDLKLCYKYYLQAPPDISKLLLSTKLPDNTKVFCYWIYNNRECYENMEIKPTTYGDIFQEAFEINGKCKNIKVNLIDSNKILFEFIK